LALALFTAQNVDQWTAKDEPKKQRCEKGPARTERDVTKEVKEITAIRKRREKIEHR
jgi:hypothetical protein